MCCCARIYCNAVTLRIAWKCQQFWIASIYLKNFEALLGSPNFLVWNLLCTQRLQQLLCSLTKLPSAKILALWQLGRWAYKQYATISEINAIILFHAWRLLSWGQWALRKQAWLRRQMELYAKPPYYRGSTKDIICDPSEFNAIAKSMSWYTKCWIECREMTQSASKTVLHLQALEAFNKANSSHHRWLAQSLSCPQSVK